MKMRLSAAGLLLGILISLFSVAQDFSNKGKDFWVGYGLHCRMFQNNTGGTQDMVLYFATEAVTNVRVEIPSVGYVQNYTIPANTIFTSNPLPKNGTQDARLTTEGISNKGIHITSDKPIVAYAHIYNGNVSGATLLFPTTTLGKEYYSINFEQHSNEGNSNCFFYAVAADTGTTTIEVIPSANTQNMVAGNTYTFNLTQGQVFNALGIISGNDGVDLTGSKIRSISTGVGGCKRIAVFSGSGKINIRCPLGTNNTSADNYMVQAFPKNAWGKYYLTVPTSRMPNNFFRIAVTDPSTVVKLNGSVLTGLINNFYYQIAQTGVPNAIEADKPVMVAQYITSANQCGNTTIGSDGDPEVIYLSPVEQNIDKVILNSTPNSAISSQYHFVNVVIPNGGTALSSFRIDGTSPSAAFVTHPQNPGYAYLVQNVSPGQHIIQSDSSFNAIAYGYGNAESYGYNAGANVKDLYQFVSVQNQYATVNFPAACKSSPFYFSITFPYQPTQVKWGFNGLFTDVTISNPVYDSTWTINGKQLYKYKLPTPYTINTIGTYPIKIIAQNPTPEGCSGEQEINYDLQVFERPVADFNFTTNGCLTDSVRFTDNTNTNGRQAIRWSWDFGGGNTSSLKNPVNLFVTPGNNPVKYSVITDIGCLSDTVSKTIVLATPPVARFGLSAPNCLNRTISFYDSSTSATSAIVKWYWDFGDNSPVVIATSNVVQTHSFSTTGPFTVKLKVESATGCQSITFSKLVIVSPNPVAGFNFGNACLPGGTMVFTNTSTISDGSQNAFSYEWNFGDASSISTVQMPSHNYAATGPFPVSLKVTSNNGCVDSMIKTVSTIYAQPVSAFTAPAEVCFGTPVNLTDQSTAPNSTVTQWQWDFGDGNSTQQNPNHNFSAPGSYTVSLIATSAVNCPSAITSKTIIVHALPASGFTTTGPDCATRDITFTDASVPNSGAITKWTWNMGDGTTFVRNSGAAFTHAFTTAGTYTVTLVTETDKGCISPVFSKQLIVHPLPLAGFIMPDNCLTDPFSPFTDTSSIADGSQAQFSWLWNFGDPNATPANPNSSTQKNPKHKYTVVGPYDVTLTVTSNNGCVGSATSQFIVNSTQPVSSFSINQNPECSNQAVKITNGSSIDVGRIVRLVIFWDDVNDPANTSTIMYPTASAVYSHTYPEFFTPVTKNYTIRVVAYSGDSCYHSSTKVLTLKATPEIVFSAIPGVCADQPSFAITQTSVLNGLAGNGVFSGNGIAASGNFNPAAAGVGTHTIRYTYTATNGCENFKEQPVAVFAVPVVTAGPDRFILEGGNALLLGSGTGNNLSYLWSPVTNLSATNIAQPLATPVDDITYSLQVTSADGCTASDQVFVKVLKTPTIPNTFSPNGDGIHDRWEIKYLESYPGATVEIFNRYGQQVYYSVGYSAGWDGNFKGKPLPAGTYYYLINPKNGRKQISGFVDIIR
jgi:gliding motility-associated-like protein